MRKIFSDIAWEDYQSWALYDKKKLKKINELIKSIERDGVLSGIGKPELLKHEMSGWYSRRIDDANRIVYRVINNCLEIASCKRHYE